MKILDFDLARMKRAVSPDEGTLTLSFDQTTTPGLVMGTISYMSPEQARGEPAEGQSDIFSLGCVLYEAISGQHPFARNTVAEVIAAVLKEEPSPLRSRATEIPAELDRVIGKALRKDRDKRYQTAGELLGDLKSLRLESELEARLRSSGGRNADSFAVPAPPHQKANPAASKTWDEIAPAGSPRVKMMIGLAVAALILVLGGWRAYRLWTQNRQGGSAKTGEAGVEALRYYLEIESGRNAATRATGFEPIGGRGFRFHFIPRNRGYLYINANAIHNQRLPARSIFSRPPEFSRYQSRTLGSEPSKVKANKLCSPSKTLAALPASSNRSATRWPPPKRARSTTRASLTCRLSRPGGILPSTLITRICRHGNLNSVPIAQRDPRSGQTLAEAYDAIVAALRIKAVCH